MQPRLNRLRSDGVDLAGAATLDSSGKLGARVARDLSAHGLAVTHVTGSVVDGATTSYWMSQSEGQITSFQRVETKTYSTTHTSTSEQCGLAEAAFQAVMAFVA